MDMPDPTVQQIASLIHGWLDQSVEMGTDQAVKIVFGNQMVGGALAEWSRGTMSNDDCLTLLQSALKLI